MRQLIRFIIDISKAIYKKLDELNEPVCLFVFVAFVVILIAGLVILSLIPT